MRRLEEIKVNAEDKSYIAYRDGGRYSFKVEKVELAKHDYEWLIKQVEYIVGLKEQSHGIELNLLNDEVVRLEKQNQIYKQALEEITKLGWSDAFGGGHSYMGEYHAQAIKIAEKALEESEWT